MMTHGTGEQRLPGGDEAAMLRSYLAERHWPCPLCGYDLRGLQAKHCPECGSTLMLQVGLAEPRMGPYIALVVALSMGAAWSTIFLVFAAVARAPSDFWIKPMAMVLYAEAFVCMLGLWFALRRRVAFRRRPHENQLVLAGCAVATTVVLTLVSIALFDY